MYPCRSVSNVHAWLQCSLFSILASPPWEYKVAHLSIPLMIFCLFLFVCFSFSFHAVNIQSARLSSGFFFALTVSLFSPRFKKEKRLFIHFFLRLLSRSLARSVFVSLGFKPRRCRVLFSLCCFMICCLHALAQMSSFILLFVPLSLSPLLSLSHCCCLYISAALIFSHLCSFLRLPLLTGLVPSILTFNLSLASFLSSVFSPFCHRFSSHIPR